MSLRRDRKENVTSKAMPRLSTLVIPAGKVPTSKICHTCVREFSEKLPDYCNLPIVIFKRAPWNEAPICYKQVDFGPKHF